MVAALLLGMASGCASFSPYSIDEATVQGHLAEQIQNFSRDIQASGLPITLELNQADVAIGPDNREIVVIDFAGKAILQVPRVPIDIRFSVEGKPEYEPDEKAIYVRNVKLLSSEIEAAGSAFNLSPLTGTLSDFASQLLNENPVYRLDEDDGAARLFGMMNLKVAIKPGRIALVPAGSNEEVQRPVR
jgi:hypothetical protein